MTDDEADHGAGAAGGHEVVVTFLEMDRRPSQPAPPLPVGPHLALIAAESPPPHWFVYLYKTVGEAYDWTDMLELPQEDLAAWVADPGTKLFTLMLDGWPGGFFVLDARTPRTVDLAYFGLVPEAVGRGLGHWFLRAAVDAAWAVPDCRKVTVNTCTLDHPRALGLYQRAGFAPARRETRRF